MSASQPLAERLRCILCYPEDLVVESSRDPAKPSSRIDIAALELLLNLTFECREKTDQGRCLSSSKSHGVIETIYVVVHTSFYHRPNLGTIPYVTLGVTLNVTLA